LPVAALTAPFTSCAVPLTSSFVPALIFFSFAIKLRRAFLQRAAG
jgi:hypothetical protein